MRPTDIPAVPPARRPVVWTVCGTDSGGGAGLHADLRALDAFGVHGASAVAATACCAASRLRSARISWPYGELTSEVSAAGMELSAANARAADLPRTRCDIAVARTSLPIHAAVIADHLSRFAGSPPIARTRLTALSTRWANMADSRCRISSASR